MTEAYIMLGLFLAACLVAAGHAGGQTAAASRERARNELEMEKLRSDIERVKEKILEEAAAEREFIAREQKTLAYRETRFKEEMLGREREMNEKKALLERESRELAAQERWLAEKEKSLNEKERELSGEKKLTEDFKNALEFAEKNSRCLFVTGAAGTGKSTLLSRFRCSTSKKLLVLAPTGVAAINVRGQTLHSFFNWPHRILLPEDIKTDNQMREILKRVEAIIIDEISMVRADQMNAIDLTLRRHLEPNIPFGGRLPYSAQRHNLESGHYRIRQSRKFQLRTAPI